MKMKKNITQIRHKIENTQKINRKYATLSHFHEQQQAKIGKKIKQKLRATP